MSTEESKSAKIAEVALITGCSSGIGLALARQLKEAGTQVYAAVRKETEELRALGVTKVITGIDVSDDSVVETLAKAVEGVKFDLVINNAGVFNVEPLDAVDTANMARQFNVNAIGPVRVFKALASNFAETGAKLVTTSSMMGSLALTQADPSIPAISYRISKAATNMWTVQAAAALKEKKIAVASVHPGFVLTKLTSQFGDAGQISPEESATGFLKAITKLSLENTGAFFSYTGETMPW